MNADLKHGSVTDKILGLFYDVYNELGHGFLESVYHRSLVLALEAAGLRVCSRVTIPVWFRGHPVGSLKLTFWWKIACCLSLKQHAPWTHRTARRF